ncbi:MAG TPA: hypothetical protein VFH27_05725, partial [Longimicrobiaceae bacterium]|nr:hypothetical protein [Longimicrobiaceae bacterium]
MQRAERLGPKLLSLALRARRALVVGLHFALVPLGYWLAFALRFDFDVPRAYYAVLLSTLPVVMALRLGAFAAFGLYHGWWRHVGMRDLSDLVKAVTVSSGALLLFLFFTGELRSYPRSLVVLDWAAAILLFGGIRFAARAMRERRFVLLRPSRGKRTLVIGAGLAADRFVRHCQQDGESKFFPVGLVDDDPAKLGMRLHGVRVLGGTSAIAALAERERLDLLVIAIPSATRQKMRDIVAACMATE